MSHSRPTPQSPALASASPDFLARLRHAIEGVTGPWNRNNILAWCKIIAIVLAIRWIWFEPFTIPSDSMLPTLNGDERFFRGDRIAVNKFVYGVKYPFSDRYIFRWHDPERWDIVVFRNPDRSSPNKILIKRLVGLPGERIHIAGGKIYVNGASTPLQLPANMPEVYYTCGPAEPWLQTMQANLTVEEFQRGLREAVGQFRYGILPEDEYSLIPPDHYLMLGDNSANSGDGRMFGWVARENIIGRTFCVWWPLSRWCDFTGYSKTWWGRGILFGLPALLILHLLMTSFVAQSWAVEADAFNGRLRRGDHAVINLHAFGVRAPFSTLKITAGRNPRPSELIIYTDKASGAEALALGLVIDPRMAGDGAAEAYSATDSECWILRESAPPGAGIGEVHRVHHRDLLGCVSSVWWPPSRRRKV